MAAKLRLVLYSKPGCHLCDEMKEAIHGAGISDLYTLEEVNIEDDPELLARYRFEIPVLSIDGVEGFRHRLDADEFKAYVTERIDNSS